MTNAMLEFIRTTGMNKVLCAKIHLEIGESFFNDRIEPNLKLINLKLNYSSEEYEKFLKDLDFEYDSGYGCQELFGTIWMQDGTWYSRGEYDGSEWWQHHSPR